MSIISSKLSYAVRTKVLVKYLGLIAVMLALLTLVPLLVAVVFQDYHIALRYLGVVVVLLALWAVSRPLPEPRHIQTNEALTIVALAFVLAPLLMTFPFMGSGLAFGDALFEAISAITTTGLSTTTNLENQSQSFLFARSWMQWYGGLGIVVLSVALLMGHHVASRSLSEPFGGETLATTTRTHARRILLIYGSLTVTGIVLVWLVSGNGMLAVHHVLAAVSTGGFSSFDTNMAGVESWYSRFAIIGLSLCGALPLSLYAVIFTKNWKIGLRDAELVALVSAIILISTLLYFSLRGGSAMNLGEALGHALLLGVSAQTTTGFATLDINSLGDSAKFSIILSMLIGGSVGSTAGGMKLWRILIVCRVIQAMLQRTTMPPQAVQYPKLGGKLLEDAAVQRALILILLYCAIVVFSWFVFLLYGYPPMNALFEVVSASATAGFSVGIAGTDLPALLKWVLCLDMLFGRVEIVALLVVLYPPNWIGKRKELT